MNGKSDIQKQWQSEVKDFIMYWEIETAHLRNQTIEPSECRRITDHFHRDVDGLLVRRPPGAISNIEVSQLEQLDNKLSNTIAMACGFKKSEE